ncbi:MAG TPA: CHASE3 domain-containing protein, partial [Anaeromyxobacteraceae bacterium]|nr:CHASE3 domain-containing protein [Anaeromyxobacteraceae bacterium]
MLTLLVAAGLLVGLVLYVRDASWWVDHTDRVIGRATLVDRLVTDRQARLRGYLLTGTPSSLSAYVEADGHVLPGIEDLRQLVNDNSSQVEHLEALQPTLVRWHEYAREQLARRSEGATPNDVAFHLVDGDAIQADIQSRLREFVAVEEALRRTRVTRADAVTRAALGLGAVFALLAGPALAITTGRRMRRTRERYQAALETQEGTALSLQASDEMLRLAKDAADMGAWHWDIASGELVWSERCKELFGLRPETEMSYEVFLAAIHPDDRAR